jgi:adenylylsulfate kinase
VVLWFTGLSGSCKSTLAHAIEEHLYRLGCRTFVFDGDNVRHGLCSDLGFSDRDRKNNKGQTTFVYSAIFFLTNHRAAK